eukprot:TRINITY_DN5412_c0_g1_i1.p1 TRINITY_DN5412_c0_g1~~TRINITY_DN5412_c0_g1_i1.p1  ORF type:complete len:289 (-),score=62.01 TRINITY_DN5412_c0_g1_i1:87-845(-)
MVASNPQDMQKMEVEGGEKWDGPMSPHMPAYIRQGFVKKVYVTLAMQLLVTFLIALPFKTVLSPQWVYTHAALGQLASIGALVLALGMACCCRQAARTYPTNYLLLGGITVCISIMVGFVTARYNTASVLLALASTSVAFISLTAYAWTTKTDFTEFGGYLGAALSSLIGFGFVMMLFSLFGIAPPFMHTIYALLGTVLFSVYIVYDTQLIAGGKRVELGPDDHVFAALNLYLDIINLFLYLLELFGSGRDN